MIHVWVMEEINRVAFVSTWADIFIEAEALIYVIY